VPEEEYEPFGPEWEKEIMNFRKADLVQVYKQVCQENISLKGKYDATGPRDFHTREYFVKVMKMDSKGRWDEFMVILGKLILADLELNGGKLNA